MSDDLYPTARETEIRHRLLLDQHGLPAFTAEAGKLLAVLREEAGPAGTRAAGRPGAAVVEDRLGEVADLGAQRACDRLVLGRDGPVGLPTHRHHPEGSVAVDPPVPHMAHLPLAGALRERR